MRLCLFSVLINFYLTSLVAFQGKVSFFIEKIPKYPSASVSGKIFLGSLDEKDFSTTFRLSNATIRFSDTYFIGSYVCLEALPLR